MSDQSEDDDGLLSFSDAAEIGFKIVEMADRLKKVAAAVPGSQAKWGFEMDDQRFEVIVTIPAGETGKAA